MLSWRAVLWALIALVGVAPAAWGNILTARFVDQKGRPIADALIVATSASAPIREGDRKLAVLDQIDKSFVPHVLPVVVGSSVSFPNKDDIRHHVYSFSGAKTFELPLYKGTPAEPVVFQKPGVVVLGCNIHDFMRGYIGAVESPYFALSGEDGIARLTDLPPGEYSLTVWHPREKGSGSAPRHLGVEGPFDLDFELHLKPALKIRRAPGGRGKRY